MGPRPKNVILDLLSTLRGRSAPVRLLIAAGEIFGIESNSTRVALARLNAAGLVERDERGAYRLGTAAQPIHAQVRSWRRIDSRCAAWSGASWIAAAMPRSSRGREERRQMRATQLAGIAELDGGLWVRPDNLSDGLDRTRSILAELGVAATVFRIRDLDATTRDRAMTLWPIADIRDGYRHSMAELAASTERLAGMETAAAMVESFLVGGRAIRRLVLDPLLPEPMVPAAGRRALLAAMNDYDLAGRAVWARFMRGFGVATAAAPMDQRLGERVVAAFQPDTATAGAAS